MPDAGAATMPRLLSATLKGDAERIGAGIVMSDADRYLPLIYPMASGADYIPKNAIIIFDQPNRCSERARDYAKQLSEDIRELQRRGLIAMGADSFHLRFEGLLKRLEEFPIYMADAFTVGRNPIPPRTLTSIPAKQLPSYAGNAQTAAEDVKVYLRQVNRVVVWPGTSAGRRSCRHCSGRKRSRPLYMKSCRSFPMRAAAASVSAPSRREWNIPE